MLGAFAWGFVAASSLIVGGVIALRYRIANRLLGLVMAFGSGVLISAVAFELVEEATDTAGGNGIVGLGLLVGSCVFFAGDMVIDRMGGAGRKDVGGDQAQGSGAAIVLGIVLDGIPESIVIGLTIVTGGAVSAAFLAAVALSNLPEAVAATSGLRAGGWAGRSILGLWTLVAAVSGVAALFGFAVFDSASAGATAFVLAFAGGAILTMLADTMMPEAFEHAGPLVGVVTTLGFAAAYGLSALE
ncbi:MAG: ZIP family metal transporter [Gaiellaceae bacterium]